ncbi:AAA family ATPase [Brevibacillus dissolubilis]|uniref:AAA family ATPase n=1 Tax=Brevibacillus dissolubilis TaxID=1844116 RepID=UPI001117789C|nr:P-loop NTPase [Brevibacillus dissolubilis]
MKIAVICRPAMYERLVQPLVCLEQVELSRALSKWDEVIAYLEQGVTGVVVEDGIPFSSVVKSMPIPILVYEPKTDYSQQLLEWLAEIQKPQRKEKTGRRDQKQEKKSERNNDGFPSDEISEKDGLKPVFSSEPEPSTETEHELISQSDQMEDKVEADSKRQDENHDPPTQHNRSHIQSIKQWGRDAAQTISNWMTRKKESQPRQRSPTQQSEQARDFNHDASSKDVIPFVPIRGRQIFTVTSAKGGTGTTTLALNTAAMLAKIGKTVIVDANLRGSVGTRLLLPETKVSLSTWEPYVQSESPLTDGFILQNLVIPHESGMHVIPAGEVTVETAGLVLMTLLRVFDFVVVDINMNHPDLLMVTATISNQVLVIADYDLATIKETQELLLHWEQKQMRMDKIGMVLNFAPDERDGNVLHKGNIREFLPHVRYLGELPTVSDMRAVQNRGKILSIHQPNHPYSKQIRNILSLIVPDLTANGKGFFFSTPFMKGRLPKA